MRAFKELRVSKHFLLFALMLSVTLLFVVGCGGENTEEEEKSTNGEEVVENSDEKDVVQEGEIKLYFTEDTGTSFVRSYEIREVERVTPQEVMEMYMEGPEEEGLFGISEDVNLLGVEIENETAYVDFSSELLDIVLGHESEAVLVDTIVSTLTDFDGIEKVQILVEGDTVESISGHISIDEPLTRW